MTPDDLALPTDRVNAAVDAPLSRDEDAMAFALGAAPNHPAPMLVYAPPSW